MKHGFLHLNYKCDNFDARFPSFIINLAYNLGPDVPKEHSTMKDYVPTHYYIYCYIYIYIHIGYSFVLIFLDNFYILNIVVIIVILVFSVL
jgi:hypothetical protein